MQGRPARLLLVGSMFVMGACGIIYEYVLSVLGNYLIGSSHEEIFIIIGLMMFAMGLGSFVQRGLHTDLLDRFLLIEIALGLVGGFATSIVYHLYAVSESYRVVLYSFAISIGGMIGMEIPILIRINDTYARSLRTNLSEILSMDYAGSLAGALLFTYVLLARVSLGHISFILGICNIVVAAAGYIVFWRLVERRALLGVVLLVSGVALAVGSAGAGSWYRWAEQRLFADPIVYRETSVYQHIVVTERAGVTNLYLNGHLQFSSRDEAIYHEILVHPAMMSARSHRQVLILGGGDGLALREVLHYSDVEQVVLVDIDPAVVKLAATFAPLVALNENAFADARLLVPEQGGVAPGALFTPTLESQRPSRRFAGERGSLAEVHVAHVDADLFLRSAEGRFDVVILDFPDPSRLEIAKLYTVGFYRRLAGLLSPGAPVVVQSASPFHARQVFRCIGETLREAGFSAIPLHQNVPSFGEWGWHLARWGIGHEEELRRGLEAADSLPVPTRYLTPEVLRASLAFGKGWLEDGPDVQPNTLLEPILVKYFSESWRRY